MNKEGEIGYLILGEGYDVKYNLNSRGSHHWLQSLGPLILILDLIFTRGLTTVRPSQNCSILPLI